MLSLMAPRAYRSGRIPSLIPILVAGLLTVLLAGLPAAGQQQEPAQEQQAEEQSVRLEEAPPESRQGARSLSDFAASTKLQRPKGAESKPLVISNENLDELSRGAVLSDGVAGSPTGPTMGKGFGQQQELERDWRRRVQDQELTVRDLENRLAGVDGKVDDYQRAGLYFSSAHYRPGGVQDPVLAFRKDLEQQLAAEQQRLNSLRKQARHDGVRVS